MKKTVILFVIALTISNPQLKPNETSKLLETQEPQEIKNPKNPEFYINYHNYQTQADKWIQKYILDKNSKQLLIPTHELQLIANLVYFSFMRSHCTVTAQSQALKTLASVWQAWQDIAQTRLDPSKIVPNNITGAQKRDNMTNFWTLHDQHQKMGATYTKCVQNIVDGNLLEANASKDSVKNMRNQARTVAAQSILNIKNYIGELFYSKNTPEDGEPQEVSNKSTKILNKKSLKSFLQKIPVISAILSYLPKISLNAFIKANKTNDLVSSKSWKILLKIQQIGARTWEMIELERAAFYLAFYRSIWRAMQDLNLDKKYTKILFNEYGFLGNTDSQIISAQTPGQSASQQTENYLPEPKKIISSS